MGEQAIHADAVLGDSLKGLRQGRAEPAAQSAHEPSVTAGNSPAGQLAEHVPEAVPPGSTRTGEAQLVQAAASSGVVHAPQEAWILIDATSLGLGRILECELDCLSLRSMREKRWGK